MSSVPFHSKYRPKSLSRILGHEQIVTRLRGCIDSEDIPLAMLFTGPTSAGKTTLARAFAHDVNGENWKRDFTEVNAGDTRGIDDIRSLISTARYRPQGNKRRFILIDEAQQLITNPAAAQALLKPLEEPVPTTTWILCSMDPTKFTTAAGKAIANRCVQFSLDPLSDDALLKFAKRIAKGESMSYASGILPQIVENSNNEPRSLANLMQAVHQFYNGLERKPKVLTEEHVSTLLDTTESSDDRLAAVVLHALYSGQFAELQVALLEVNEPFMFVQKLIWANSFMLNSACLNGKRHRKVWPSKTAKTLQDLTRKDKITLGTFASTHAALVRVRSQAGMGIPEVDLLSAVFYELIVSRG